MDTWNAVIARAAARRGVVTPADVRAAGVPASTWADRIRAEGWSRPYRGVAVAPWAPAGPLTDLAALLAACPTGSAASGRTAAWLQGLDTTRTSFEVVVPAGRRVPDVGRHRAHRSRWLRFDDVTRFEQLPCLDVAATVVTRHREPVARLRAYVIDATHRRLTEVADVAASVSRVATLPGRGPLLAMLADLAGRSPESTFHDIVLTDLLARGYDVDPHPRPIVTPDGRGVTCDIAVPAFCVALEPEGDRWHRTRPQRRADRRRIAQYAGTPWVPVPIDWDDWHDRRRWVLCALDAAIRSQVTRGIGSEDDLPPHLR